MGEGIFCKGLSPSPRPQGRFYPRLCFSWLAACCGTHEVERNIKASRKGWASTLMAPEGSGTLALIRTCWLQSPGPEETGCLRDSKHVMIFLAPLYPAPDVKSLCLHPWVDIGLEQGLGLHGAPTTSGQHTHRTLVRRSQ